MHCGIEPQKFDDPRPVPAGRPITLVNIGRFSEQKGQMILVDAMAELMRRGIDVRLKLVGDGELRGTIERAIKQAGLGAHVELTGWMDEGQVRKVLAESHALVLPSFAEGLPMVIMEAMVSARPVISTWVAGIPELVQDGRTGWLVPAGDVDALVEAITTLATTGQDVLTRMGTTGRARVLTRHSVDLEAGKLAGHFSQRPRTQPS